MASSVCSTWGLLSFNLSMVELEALSVGESPQFNGPELALRKNRHRILEHSPVWSFSLKPDRETKAL
jgi:hypothetical protein